MKKRRTFKESDKSRAVEDYVSGKRTAAQIGASLGCAPNLVYRWKAEADVSKRDLRASDIVASGIRDASDVRRILDLEDELDEYKRTVAQQTVLIDLLKKLDRSKNYQPESELLGLIRTTNKSARRRSR